MSLCLEALLTAPWRAVSHAPIEAASCHLLTECVAAGCVEVVPDADTAAHNEQHVQ